MVNYFPRSDFSKDIINYFDKVRTVISNLDLSQIQTVCELIIDAYLNERFIFVFGNGGSASTASHLMTDFNKGISHHLEKKFKVICLNDNIPLMLAISNDYHYEDVFKCQLENYLNENDLVIGISGSGNSVNILEAIKFANSKGANTVGLVGFDGGQLKKLAKYTIHVPINNMQIVEDLHLSIQHMIVSVLTEYFRKYYNNQISQTIFTKLTNDKKMVTV